MTPAARENQTFSTARAGPAEPSGAGVGDRRPTIVFDTRAKGTSMELGKGLKEASASKLLDKISADLRAGETAVLMCKCNNLRPMVDRVLVTDQRLLAASTADGKVKWQADLSDVTHAKVDSTWAGSGLTITPAGAKGLSLKGMDPNDAESVAARLASSVLPHLPPPGEDPAVGKGPTDRSVAATARGALAKAKQAYTDAQEATQALERSNRASYGRLVQKGTFGAQNVEIYESGHVRVGLFLSARSTFERLSSIRFTTQVQDKSAGGRALAAGVTMGLSSLTSKEKRVLFLTIATDRKVHTLTVEGGMGRAEDKIGLALEAAGNAVLDAHRRPEPASQTAAPSAQPPTIGEQVRELAELHRSGVLSDEEFARAKAKVLDSL